MNLKKIRKIADQNAPKVEKITIPGSYRHNVIDPLNGDNNIGIELGVAQGVFSKKMTKSGKFLHFYGVDMYADTIHNTEEYKLALKNIGLINNYTLLRMTFNDALDLFDDNYFDFIYIDGFAHTGEEGGETLNKWYKKLRVGGIFAGDDYHADWPLVIWAVNNFTNQTNSILSVTEKSGDTAYCQYPSWYIKKESECKNLTTPEILKNSASHEKQRIEQKRWWLSKVKKIKDKVKSITSNKG